MALIPGGLNDLELDRPPPPLLSFPRTMYPPKSRTSKQCAPLCTTRPVCEPTSALDPLTTDQILDLIVRVNQELDITVVIITHEMGVISRIADTVVVMEDGHVIENGSVSGVFSNSQQPLTQRLVETVLPQHLPASVQETVNASHYDRVLRVTHHSGAAKGLVSGLVQRGIDTDIVHASDVALRDGTVSTLVLELANEDEAALDDAVQWIQQQGQLNAEVVN